MMFLHCPAYLDQDGALRCGLPAEVTCRHTMRSTDGPIEAAMISCPAGHHFNGSIESLTRDGNHKHEPGTAGLGSMLGVTASSTVMMIVTVAADLPCGISTPGRNGRFAARTVLPPTTWAARPPYGSPPCARAGGPPPRVTRWRQPSTAVTEPRTPGCSSTGDSPGEAKGHP